MSEKCCIYGIFRYVEGLTAITLTVVFLSVGTYPRGFSGINITATTCQCGELIFWHDSSSDHSRGERVSVSGIDVKG